MKKEKGSTDAGVPRILKNQTWTGDQDDPVERLDTLVQDTSGLVLSQFAGNPYAMAPFDYCHVKRRGFPES